MNISSLATEKRNAETLSLDTMTPLEIAQAMNREDAKVAQAVEKALPEIAQVIAMAEETFLAGGRLFYIGAGTSGRLGVVDASECPPTFGVSHDMVVGIIAGGDTAIRTAVEGAEDDCTLAEKDLCAKGIRARDMVVGIAASGRTPYVIGGLRFAKALGCRTASVACSPESLIGKEADIAIEVMPGPEVLTGSTRLKAGTAQKMVLNMITTGAMVRIGKCYTNLMVDVVQSNEKLRVRAENIVMEAADCDRDTARRTLDAAQGSAKVAIVMLLTNADAAQARETLRKANGHIRNSFA